MFGGVKYQLFINSNGNFQDFVGAMLMLFQMSSGDEWNLMMREAMIQPPYCTRTWEHPELWDVWGDTTDDCGSSFAPVFFILIYVTLVYIFMNLVIAVILENFSHMYSKEEARIQASDFDVLKDKWAEFDEKAKGYLLPADFKSFVESLNRPFAFDMKREEKRFERVEITVMEYERQEKGLPFRDVVRVLALNSLGVGALTEVEAEEYPKLFVRPKKDVMMMQKMLLDRALKEEKTKSNEDESMSSSSDEALTSDESSSDEEWQEPSLPRRHEISAKGKVFYRQWISLEKRDDDDEVSGAIEVEARGKGASVIVTVFRGRGLVSKDAGGKSDPFVTVTVAGKRKQSKVVKKTLDPEWGEEFEFAVSDVSENITIECWDYDRFDENDFMGYVSIPVSRVLDSDALAGEFGNAKWYKLEMNKKDPPLVKAGKNTKVHPEPEQESEVQLDLRWLKKGKLQVRVISARNLFLQQRGRTSLDPYSIVQIGVVEHKTQVVKNSNAPMWNEAFDFDLKSAVNETKHVIAQSKKANLKNMLSLANYDTNAVTIRVYDFNRFDLDAFIGKAVLPLTLIQNTSSGRADEQYLDGLSPNEEETMRYRLTHCCRGSTTVSREQLQMIRDNGWLLSAPRAEELGIEVSKWTGAPDGLSYTISECGLGSKFKFNPAGNVVETDDAKSVQGTNAPLLNIKRVFRLRPKRFEQVSGTLELMLRQEEDVLEITVVRGAGLVAKDRTGTSDPYVCIVVGERKVKTKVARKTLNPQYDETFHFMISKTEPPSTILVECLDCDRVGKDDPMGQVRVMRTFLLV
uniref:Uncharacterized protein n=1 Tax=Palpitomonas bilix TaxID=652834 RepID=A0A7S3G1E6_9EUKA